MALTITFLREPLAGGDLANWAGYLLAQTRGGGLGALSSEMYNNAGALTVRCGFVGINNGVTRGMAEVTVSGDISLAGLTDGQWAQVELSVAGTAGAITIASMGASYTDESTIPANIKAAYDESKQGYYLTATKRLIGCVFIRTGAVLGRVVSCESGKLGFKGIVKRLYIDNAGTETIKYIDTVIKQKTGWNMATTEFVALVLPFSITNYSFAKTTVYSNSGYPRIGDVDTGFYAASLQPLNEFTCYRTIGGSFDTVAFNNATVKVEIEYET